MLKNIIVDFFLGFLVIFLVMFAEMLVTLPFAGGTGNGSLLNLEFALAALPSFLVTFGLAAWLRSTKLNDTVRRSLLWAVMLLIFYLVIGKANETLGLIVAAAGFYVLMAGVLAGPFVYWLIRRKNRGNNSER